MQNISEFIVQMLDYEYFTLPFGLDEVIDAKSYPDQPCQDS